MKQQENDSGYFSQIMGFLNHNSKMISELTDIVENVASGNPDALTGNFAEYFIRSSLGDGMYGMIADTYKRFLGNAGDVKSGGGKGDADG